MNSIPEIMIRIYAFLLRFYPKVFRNEFEEEMLLDFSDLLEDAHRRGKFSLMRFCMHEAVDFPVNLLRLYIQQGTLFRVFRSRPVNFALRGSLGYGVVFGLAVLISEIVSVTLYIDSDSIIGNLQVFFFDLFHTEHGLELIGWIPNALASLLSGLVLGILLAIFFADRTNYRRYVLAGMFGWFLHDAITSILWSTVNLGFFLGTKHMIYLFRTETVLSGMFLAFTFIVAKSEKKEPMHWLLIASLAYPLTSYLYVQLLFKLSIVETPWMFIALMGLMVVYIGSVFVFSLRSGAERRIVWIIVAGALGYPLIPYAAHIFVVWVSLLIPPVVLPAEGAPTGSLLAWQFMFRLALDNAIFGLIFGLTMGLIFGLLNRRKPQLAAA